MLLLLSSAAYLAAYLYESGFARHFRIPTEFINIDINTILIVGSLFASVAFLVFQLLNIAALVQASTSDTTSGWLLLAKKHGLLVSLMAILWIIGGYYKSDVIRTFWFNGLWFLVDIVPALLLRKEYGSVSAALHKILHYQTKPKQPSALDLFPSAQNVVLMVMLALFLAMIAGQAGLGEARRKTKFAVDDAGNVLLRTYGANMVFGTLSPAKDCIEPVFLLRSGNESDAGSRFTIVELGEMPETKPLNPSNNTKPSK